MSKKTSIDTTTNAHGAGAEPTDQKPRMDFNAPETTIDAFVATAIEHVVTQTARHLNSPPMPAVPYVHKGVNDVPYTNTARSEGGDAMLAQQAEIERAAALTRPKPARWKMVGIERVPGCGYVHWHEFTWETNTDGAAVCIDRKHVMKMSRGEALERLMLANAATMTALA